MKSLERHNADRQQFFQSSAQGDPMPNGIECPDCDTELLDTYPNVTLASNPPQKNTHCPGCGYRGYRIA